MKSWTIAYSEFARSLNSLDEDVNINKVAEYIVLDSTITTPMLLVDNDKNIIRSRNIFGKNRFKENSNFAISQNEKIDYNYVKENKDQLIFKFKNENEPLVMADLGQTLYYGNSPLIDKLKYYPLALLLIIFLFAAVVYFFYRSSKNAAQNKLWTGMAKETAHQIGTPLSSLVGWTEILKSENVNPQYIIEIEKDIDRLQTITERFSKIGSAPTLEKLDVVEITESSYEYLKSRSSKLIDFEIKSPDKKKFANINPQLFSWTIENLVKNAIDAMKGKGKLKLAITSDDKFAHITIEDTGKGIPKNMFTKIFEPGYTTKKRGWGLGLSLAKRIIEDYHKGKIKVLNSEIDKGTTFQISLKLLS